MAKQKRNSHWGSALEDFLEEEGIGEDVKAEAVARVVAWQAKVTVKRDRLRKRD
jgi:antitoxin HicB